jgi:integrase/recombinase XerD
VKSLLKAELESLLAVAEKHDPHFALALLVTFNHGLRVSETLSLSSANLVNGYLVIQRLKGSRKTTQPLLPNERERLEALTTPGRFWGLSRFAFYRRLQVYGKQAGIPVFKLHPHTLKHTTGRLGYEGGMGIPELQTYLGHENGKNTMIYMEAPEDVSCSAFAAAVGR